MPAAELFIMLDPRIALALALACCIFSLQASAATLGGKNVILFITDQERHIMHFPKGWAEANLPGLRRLQRHGVTFTNAITSSCMCSPARATMLTGLMPVQHGVRYTLEQDMPAEEYPQVQMPTSVPNIATVARAAGYQAVYKGKLHIDKPSSPDYVWQASDIEKYNFTRWDFPDAGANQSVAEGGGGYAANDDRFMYADGSVEAGEEGAIAFLRKVAPLWSKDKKPFFLVISLINPHDVIFYPGKGFHNLTESEEHLAAIGYNSSFLDGDMYLPATFNENLRRTKPQAQQQLHNILTLGLGPLPTPISKVKYLNFYSNLMKEVDQHVVATLDTLEQVGLLDDTVIIRTSDHGEMGMAHGGLRQKMFNAYEETLRVPLVFSNPVLYPREYKHDLPVSHVDLLPTLASLLGAPKSAHNPNWPGMDYSDVVVKPGRKDAGKGLRDYAFFTYDDFQTGSSQPPRAQAPCNVVAVREKRYKIIKYYDPLEKVSRIPPQYEMYDMKKDPDEKTNLAYDGKYGTQKAPYRRTPLQEAQYKRLLAKLEELEKAKLQPVPTTQVVNLTAYLIPTGIDIKDRAFNFSGDNTGVPTGRGLFELKLDPANIRPGPNAGSPVMATFQVTSRIGILYGAANVSLDSAAGGLRDLLNATFSGPARFTGGVGIWSDVRNDMAGGLRLEGAPAGEGLGRRLVVRLTGTAVF